MEIKQWLETPNVDLSAALSYGFAVPPMNLLGTTALRTFLLVAGIDRDAPAPPPKSVSCQICGRSYLDDDYLSRHQTLDHLAIGRKAEIQ
jgi:hypothetical protein